MFHIGDTGSATWIPTSSTTATWTSSARLLVQFVGRNDYACSGWDRHRNVLTGGSRAVSMRLLGEDQKSAQRGGWERLAVCQTRQALIGTALG
jgi:hypothetical protein